MSTPGSSNPGSGTPGSGTSGSEPGLFQPPPAAREPRSTLPWIIAGGVAIVILGLVVAFAHRGEPANPGGAGLAPADPYAASLPISRVQMSEANSMVGNNTYIDGQITNTGDKVVTGITVQVAFRDATNQIVQKNTMAVNLIRTREPYVDTEPVSAAPIGPRQSAAFRLIFDHVAEAWNQNYPEIRIIQVTGK
ncbi:MAG TPA: DUF2393 family protein [Acidobacteriaceae bacterium]|jgi:hypothetical protein|nr:DUF2393 family protein [Acidobacteriaceae bacterium]